MLCGELGQSHPSQGGEDVESNEVLVTAPRHGPRALFCDIVQPRFCQ
jgi:hypothetical protein